MNQKLQDIFDIIQQSGKIDDEQKNNLLKAIIDADKELELTAFKLDRTEKVKKTTAILLEETIEELEQKRKDVEEHNRELEIEATLERVRAVAMSMKKPADLLSVAKTHFIEFKTLGFNDIRNALIAIFNDEGGFFLDHTYSDYSGGSINKVFYNSHPVIKNFINESRKAKDDFMGFNIDKIQLNGWKEFIRSHEGQDDPTLNNINVLYYYNYSIEFGAIGISAFKPVSEEQLAILKRFRNVFDLAYKRYNDITLAEAQAREAQIEASLERVRAVAMSMHKSDDLISICEVSFKEFQKLGFINIRNALIHILNDEKGYFWDYDYSDSIGGSINKIYYQSHPILGDYLKQIKSAEDAFAEIIIGDDQLNSWREFRKKSGQSEDPRLDEATALYYYLFSIGIGDIGISTFKPIDDSQIKILKRFRNVFDLAYRRYTDIAKAEAQAREAQVEAALERVRSRSMAMHYTSELQDVINTVHQQFTSLDIAITGGAFIAINEENKNEIACWGAGGTADYVERVQIPFFDRPIYTGLIECIQNGSGFFTEEFSYEEKIEFFNHLFKNPPYSNASLERKKEVLSRKGGYTRSCAVSKYTNIFIINHHGRKFSEEENNILVRFGKVFEQSYTRFLDLQKSEAQTREAQIQLALERVRARTMAMQKSDELAETAYVLYEQFGLLGENPEQLTIGIVDETKKIWEFWLTLGGNQVNHVFKAPIKEPIVLNKSYIAWKEKKRSLVIDISGDELKAYYNFFKSLPDYEEYNEYRNSQGTEQRRVIHYAFFSKGSLSLASPEPKPAETIQLLERFAGVLEQTYTRFLDLQKAEAQAREAQIEAALERVRTRAMAMHDSNDVGNATAVMFSELEKLGIHTLRYGIQIIDESKIFEVWAATTSGKGKVIQIVGKLDSNLHALLRGVYKAWKDKESFFTYELKGKDIIDYYSTISSAPYYEVPAKEDISQNQFCNVFFFKEGGLFTYTLKPFSDEDIQILKKFAALFGLTYRRFLDLKKAEAQAREAQIEAALERVRSRTMAMQKSEELKEVIQLVYDQFVHLKINVEHTGFIMDYKARDDLHIWLADQNEIPSEITIPCFDSTPNNSIKEAKETGQDFFTYLLTFDEKNKFYRDLFKFIPGVPEESLEYYFNCPGLAGSGVLLENVGLYIENFSGTPYTDEENKTLMRFGKVFQQTYTRFLDLQKAEALAREAQIETALEKVRSLALGMRKSEEVGNVTDSLFAELNKLSVDVIGCSIVVIDEEEDIMETWRARSNVAVKAFEKTSFTRSMDILKKNLPEWFAEYFNALRSRKNNLINEFKKGERSKFLNSLAEEYNYTIEEKAKLIEITPKEIVVQLVFSKLGYLALISEKKLSDEDLSIAKRFVEVFDFAYTRFLDIKKAEVRAREAQIEAALERVRNRTMAMQHSDELAETAGVLFEQFVLLGIDPKRCVIGIIDQAKESAKLWFTSSDGKVVPGADLVPLNEQENLIGLYQAWKNNEQNFYFKVQGQKRVEWTSYMVDKVKMHLPEYQPDTIDKELISNEPAVFNSFFFTHGFVMLHTAEELQDPDIPMLKRFAGVFEQTYTRFLDLKNAEAQAKEAIRQASLDRIRGEIASMRTTEDLNRITPIIWRELKSLEVPFIRCGVFIVDEGNKKVQVYLSTPDGRALGALDLFFDSTKLITNTVDCWKKEQVYKEHWNKEQFIKWTKSMMELGQVQNAETYQGSVNPPESLDLHFVPFSQGMLYVGDVSPLTDEKLDLVKTLAESFSIAYARYEDFKNIEEAKNKIEITLNELKATQAQLVHSEKMASLGELTAGIAHEIKNPLNFVNNFSEVSRELLDEMKSEIENKNLDEVIELIKDLKQNLEKINQHGKRADSIVKGMLLHSRGTAGEKTLADINDLLDQYVNLAYHGMRATNKEFNITIKKDYDETLEKINVVPQDISRVFLNIINNACYAAYDKKKKSNDNNFSPVLKVSTKNLNEKVEIRIGDNGKGIPADHLEKIFQPFFTTKPSGEGTGLGLSLSYDIVTKVHGGDLKVETKEGEGTEFIIILKA